MAKKRKKKTKRGPSRAVIEFLENNPRWTYLRSGCCKCADFHRTSYYPRTGFLQYKGFKFWTQNPNKTISYLENMSEESLKILSDAEYESWRDPEEQPALFSPQST